MIESRSIIVSDGSSCTPYARIALTVPAGTPETTFAPWPSDGCSSLEVHPVVAGATGSLPPR